MQPCNYIELLKLKALLLPYPNAYVYVKKIPNYSLSLYLNATDFLFDHSIDRGTT